MEVFHFLAEELKDIPLFQSSLLSQDSEENRGAVYNDFDFDTGTLLDNFEVRFSEIANEDSSDINPAPLSQLVPSEAVENAILEADDNDGVLYEHITFDSPFFDCESPTADDTYMEKVYALAMGEYKNCHGGGERAEEIFEMRRRNKWMGPDSVYDAWLLSNRETREWFPYEVFLEKYPDWEEDREKLIMEREEIEESDIDEGNESEKSLFESYDEEEVTHVRLEKKPNIPFKPNLIYTCPKNQVIVISSEEEEEEEKEEEEVDVKVIKLPVMSVCDDANNFDNVIVISSSDDED